MKLNNFSRRPKYRKALFRNLLTELFMHERITTTYAKAKYMMPMAERVIRIAKSGFPLAYKPLQRVFYQKDPIRKVVNEIAPRLKDIKTSHIRIQKTHKRKLDKAQMAQIEIIGNYLEIYENNEREKRKQTSNTPNFWDWEQKILEQEKEFVEGKIEEYQALIAPIPQPGENIEKFLESDSKKLEEKKNLDQKKGSIPDPTQFDYAEYLVKTQQQKIVGMTPEVIQSNKLIQIRSKLDYYKKNLRRVNRDMEIHLQQKDSQLYRKKDRKYTFDN